jgi:hypothetical protein
MDDELISPPGFMYQTTENGVFLKLHIGVWAGGIYHFIEDIIGWDFS